MSDPISEKLKHHYNATFLRCGPTPAGVDWGENEERAARRHKNMLALISDDDKVPSLLDVGCGYGALLQYARQIGVDLDYTGVDVSERMIDWAKINYGESAKFVLGDVLTTELPQTYDYVVCNGILTQKLDVASLEMDRYAGALIRRMFALCNKGIAFNIMTTKVNFFSNNLYYRNPAEMLAWCMTELTPHVRLDHAYPMFEYTLYLYTGPR